jgi:hypothetical protein
MTRLVGIDLGGTSIRAALSTGPTTYAKRVVRRPTPASSGPEAVISACAEAARDVARGTPDGVAIGIPGPLDPERGVVFAAPHLPGFEDLPAREMLSEAAGCPVAIHNDSNLAGYGEWAAGMGRGARIFILVTMGTGIGGAVIIDGTLLVGTAGTAAEMGHVPWSLDGPLCGQGHPGCLEGIASGTGIARCAAAALAAGEESSLRAITPLTTSPTPPGPVTLSRRGSLPTRPGPSAAPSGPWSISWGRTPSLSAEVSAAPVPICSWPRFAQAWRRSASSHRSSAAGWDRPSSDRTPAWSGRSPGSFASSVATEVARTAGPGRPGPAPRRVLWFHHRLVTPAYD